MWRVETCLHVCAGIVPDCDSSAHLEVRARGCVVELGLDQAAADCVSGQVDAVAHAESVQDVRSVSFDGLDAEHKQVGDLL